MIAQIELEKSELKQILDSIHSVAAAADHKSIDINMIVEETPSVKFYVNQYGYFQVQHDINESDKNTIIVKEPRNFVFGSKTLRSIINKVKSGTLALKFFEHSYAVRVGTEGTFSTPLSLDLNLYQESQFHDPIEPDQMSRVVSVDRLKLSEALDVMNSIWNIVRFKITNDELWIAVSDKVEGEGKVMKEIDPDCELENVSQKFQIRPILSFLQNVGANEIEIQMTEEGDLLFIGETEGHLAKLLIQETMDTQH